MPTMATIIPHLWYANEAEEGARFYTSIFPDSRIERVTDLPTESRCGDGSINAYPRPRTLSIFKILKDRSVRPESILEE
jgi:hypothetical protein